MTSRINLWIFFQNNSTKPIRRSNVSIRLKIAKKIFQSHRRQNLHMFIGVREMAGPRNEASRNTLAATTVVDMAQENRLGAGWTNNRCLPRRQTGGYRGRRQRRLRSLSTTPAYEYYTVDYQTVVLVFRKFTFVTWKHDVISWHSFLPP